MADNVTLPGTGSSVATDDIGGIQFQKMKLNLGASGVDGGEVTSDNPLPVAAYGELIEATEAMRMAIGALVRTVGLLTPNVLGQLRVSIDAGTLATVTTVGTVTTTGTLSNQTNMGGYGAADQVPALMHLNADCLRRNITVT